MPTWRIASRTWRCSNSKKLPLSIPTTRRSRPGSAFRKSIPGRGKQGFATLEQVFATEAGAPVAGPTLVLTELRAGHLDKAAEVASSLDQARRQEPALSYLARGGPGRSAGLSRPQRMRSAPRWRIDPAFPAATRDLAQLYTSDRPHRRSQESIHRPARQEARRYGRAARACGHLHIAEKKWPEATDAINRARSAARNDPAPGLKLVSLYEAASGLEERRDGGGGARGAISARLSGSSKRKAGPDRGRRHRRARCPAISALYDLAPNSIPILSRYLALLNSEKHFGEAKRRIAAGHCPRPSK